MLITRGSQLWWSSDFLATCLSASIHVLLLIIQIKYDDDDDDDDSTWQVLITHSEVERLNVKVTELVVAYFTL